MKLLTTQTVQRISFTSIATILIPLGVGIIPINLIGGLLIVVVGIGALVLREIFKSA